MIKLKNLLIEEALIEVPKDFNSLIADLHTATNRKAKFYAQPLNQLKIDLIYGIKGKMIDLIDDFLVIPDEKKYDTFKQGISNELDSVLFKFSGGKYDIFPKSDLKRIKKIIETEVFKIVKKNYADSTNKNSLATASKIVDKSLNTLTKSRFLTKNMEI